MKRVFSLTIRSGRSGGRLLSRCLLLPTACLLVVCPFGAGCGPGDANRERSAAVAEMQFSVDPSLLGPAVTDSLLRLTFRPPAGLLPADSGMVRGLRDEAVRAARPGDPLAVEPVLLFATPAGGACCRVGRFLAPPPGRLDPVWVDSCRADLQRQVAPAAVASDLYRVRRTTVVAQFLARNESMVLFRLLCQGPGRAPIVIDYLVPVGDYPGQARAIESSIGSLETF